MQHAVAIVADDLTGAADTGGAFAAAGLATVVTWASVVVAGARFDDHDVVSVDLGTRIGDATQALTATSQVVRMMRDAGVEAIYKKCDSLLRGHIGHEISAALAAWHPSSIAIAAFAFPSAGRTTIDGRQHVGGCPLDRPPIATLLEDAGLSARSIDREAIRGGAFSAVLQECLAAGVEAVVCDAETEEDLRVIAEAGAPFGRNIVWVGSGGLARALPRALRLKSHMGPPQHARRHAEPGPILFVVGSTSKIARLQASRAIAAGARHVVIPVDMLTRARERDEGPATVSEIARHFRDGRDVVVTIGELSDVDVRERPTGDRLGELLRPYASIARGLVVTGGDTATTILRAWDTTALHLIDEVEPGVPVATSVAPISMPVVTKAGAFGDDTSLVRAAAHVRRLFA